MAAVHTLWHQADFFGPFRKKELQASSTAPHLSDSVPEAAAWEREGCQENCVKSEAQERLPI